MNENQTIFSPADLRANVAAKAKRGPKNPSKYTKEFLDNEADALIKYALNSPHPFFKEFCPPRGYSSQVVHSCNFLNNEKFCFAYNVFRDISESKIALGALTNKFNSYMAFAFLKNIAGWRDKTEVTGEVKFDIQSLITDIHRTEKENSGRLAKVSSN